MQATPPKNTPREVRAEDLIKAGDKICEELKKPIIFSPVAWGVLSTEFKRLRDNQDARDIINYIDTEFKKPGWCLTLATSLNYKVKEPL